MILEIVVDNNSLNLRTNYKIGKNDGYSLDFDVDGNLVSMMCLAMRGYPSSISQPKDQYFPRRNGLQGTLPQQHRKNLSVGFMDLREATSDEVTWQGRFRSRNYKI